MDRILKLLLDDHLRMRRIFDLFERELAAFGKGRPADYDVLAGALDLLSEYLGAVHHPLEDRMLERLRRRDAAAAGKAADLDQRHRELEDLTLEVSQIFAAVRDDTIAPRKPLCERGRNLLQAYREHMDWEESELFPAVGKIFTADDWEAISIAAGAGVDPLRERPAKRRFAALMHRLDADTLG
ncbi:MAG: hemerythrin domain-containing protein [Gammaproteobacteria bacterium]|nr:hemerythrin domain-containing protein [Gammaproteobacteria bacterium]